MDYNEEYRGYSESEYQIYYAAIDGCEVLLMELIRISENKIKIMLNASDMTAYDLPSEGFDYCESTVREAFRAVLKDAGRKTGMDFSDSRLSIQLYPSKSGGCEMFVTRNGDSTGFSAGVRSRGKTLSPERDILPDPEAEESHPRWERAEAFGFESMQWLLSVCKRLKRVGFSGNSAAFRDENGKCFLLIEAPGSVRSLIIEYGTPESPEAVRLYISEHGDTLCAREAVEILGEL